MKQPAVPDTIKGGVFMSCEKNRTATVELGQKISNLFWFVMALCVLKTILFDIVPITYVI